MGAMTTIELKNVKKKFGEIVAVDNLNLKVKDSEFLVIVGPTGCGKTTILRLIAGLEKPDSGNIYFDGKIVNNLGPISRGVRMVFESYALYPHMKVFDEKKYSNLSFGLMIQKHLGTAIKDKVLEVANKTGIESALFSRKPKQLSEGQKEKVAVGRAIAIKPKVFLMDDPLKNLDPQSKLRIRREILRIHKDLKTTTIYVTHNLADAMAMADRIAIMKERTFVQVDTPQMIYNHPINGFVEDFIKSYDLL